MKKLFLVLLFLSLTFQVYSQQRYVGQWVVKAAGGMNVSSLGYVVEIGGEYMFTRGSSLQFSALYNRNTYSCAVDEKVKVNNIGGVIYYAYAFMPTKPIRISVLGGMFVTDQSIPPSTTPGVVINAASKVNFGLSFAGQVDFSLAPRVSLYIQPTLNYSILSDIDNISFLASLGLKFYF